ncbi:MAG TPA: nucleotidyltransferase family protein [Chitinophagaceae bacterium]|nr:nucleotidyltransferase family protein [Chitinophagaceae bacterium]
MSRIHYTVEHCAIVVLAAGMSSRLRSPKQLLRYQGKSLVQYAVDTALQTTMRPVVVVVGANSDAVKKEIERMNVEIIENKEWEEGMASSIRSGLNYAQKKDDKVDGIIFMVCDQPYVNGSLLESLLQEQHKTGLPVVASNYDDKLGTPALFHKVFFNELMELKGDTGAIKLIKQHEDLVTSVAFPKCIIDIDTKKDYEDLLQ